MSTAITNGIEVHYEETGDGETLVLVHGGWSDLDNWDPVVGALARSRRVVAYDRRGSGSSSRDLSATRRDHEDDLAGLIEHLGDGPVHVAGTSFGASIALGLTVRRPELIRSLVLHEPPLLSTVAGDPEMVELLTPVAVTVQAVAEGVERGDAAGAAKRFVEELAFGPGAWDLLPEAIRATMIDSAPAFVAEQRDPEWAIVDIDRLASIACPVLLTQGAESPPWFGRIVAALDEAIDAAAVHTYGAAGHAPHLSHPAEYQVAVEGFLSACESRTAHASPALS